MKTHHRHFGYMLGLCVLSTGVFAAEPRRAPPTEMKEMRVNVPPGHDRRGPIQIGERRPMEKETVAFLGVETTSVSSTISSQLGLPPGTGLVVNHVLPQSPSANVLNEHDILLKLDDQILIETRQLAVLIRTHKEGDEVEVTYMRRGQKATAKVKLGKQEVPKLGATFETEFQPFGVPPGAERWREMTGRGIFENRADADRLLSMMQRGPRADAPAGGISPPVRIQIDHNGGPGFRAMSVHTNNSNLVFDDGKGALELTLKDGAKNLVAKDPDGKTIFSGSVTTPEERKDLPEGLRERLEKLEGMQDVTFRTDGDFRGGEMRVPRPRGISFPSGAGAPQGTPPSKHF